MDGLTGSRIPLLLARVFYSGLASLYKEKSIIDYSLPTDIHSMSCWLFFYQFIISLVCFPIFYLFQGTGAFVSGWLTHSCQPVNWLTFILLYCVVLSCCHVIYCRGNCS